MQFELYSSSFCGACRRTRAVLDRVAELVPDAAVHEYDVAFSPDAAAGAGIDATPTVIVRSASGAEVARATGVPTIDQALVAAARARDHA